LDSNLLAEKKLLSNYARPFRFRFRIRFGGKIANPAIMLVASVTATQAGDGWPTARPSSACEMRHDLRLQSESSPHRAQQHRFAGGPPSNTTPPRPQAEVPCWVTGSYCKGGWPMGGVAIMSTRAQPHSGRFGCGSRRFKRRKCQPTVTKAQQKGALEDILGT